MAAPAAPAAPAGQSGPLQRVPPNQDFDAWGLTAGQKVPPAGEEESLFDLFNPSNAWEEASLADKWQRWSAMSKDPAIGLGGIAKHAVTGDPVGTVIAGAGVMGGGLDPLLGVPQDNIPVVEEDEPRGLNPRRGKSEVFWAKPPGWTDEDGEWDFYWPQGVTPPQYATYAAEGGLVRGYAEGGYVAPPPGWDRDRDGEWDWQFGAQDNAPPPPPLPEAPLTAPPDPVAPLLPREEGGGQLEDLDRGVPPTTWSAITGQKPAPGDASNASASTPSLASLAKPLDVAQRVVGPATTIATTFGNLNPFVGAASFGLGQLARVASNKAHYRQEPIGFWEDVLKPDIFFGSPEQIHTKADEREYGWDDNRGDTSGIADTFTNAGQGWGDENYFNKGGMIRRYQEGGPVDTNNPIVQGAIAAIMGQHPEPQKAVQVYIGAYGPQAFAKLRQTVIAKASQSERQGSGLGAGFVRGPGDGLSENVPANIEGQEPVALSDGEVVVPADVVSGLGNGSSEAGAEILESMNTNVREQRTGKKSQPRAIDPAQMIPV